MLSHISTIEHQSPPWLLRPDFHVFTLFHSLMFNNHQTIVYQQTATKQHSLKKKIMLNFDENVFESMLWMFLVHQCSYFHPVIRRWVFWQGLNPMQPPRLSCNGFWYPSFPSPSPSPSPMIQHHHHQFWKTTSQQLLISVLIKMIFLLQNCRFSQIWF